MGRDEERFKKSHLINSGGCWVLLSVNTSIFRKKNTDCESIGVYFIEAIRDHH